MMGKPAILCVDDELIVLNSLKIELKNAFQDKYQYEVAESGDEALEIIAELQAEDIDIIVIVSDWLMPDMKGDELLIKIHENSPKIIKILLTGQADASAIARAKEQANLHCCLYKPWASNELIATIKSALTKL